MKLTRSKLVEIITEEIQKLNEGKIIRLEILSKDKKKVLNIIKQLRLKDTKDYALYGSGRTVEMELDSKFQNKFLELAIKNNIKIKEV